MGMRRAPGILTLRNNSVVSFAAVFAWKEHTAGSWKWEID
jgi:hypothetical protein